MQSAELKSTTSPNCLDEGGTDDSASAVYREHMSSEGNSQQAVEPEPDRAAPADPYKPLQEGEEIDHYRVLRVLSKRNAGAVYLCEDTTELNRIVVVNESRSSADVGDEQSFQEASDRFFAEVNRLERLEYRGIPQVFDTLATVTANYLVVEYIKGQDLAQGLAQQAGKAYPEAQVIRWGVAVSKILEYLAQQQPPLIHGAIKPAKLLIDANSNEIWLVGFEIVGEPSALPHSNRDGVLGYAAPELGQGTGEPRSDVYALAATLYHLATGDDPSLHPSSFPFLKAMGKFGQVLERALAADVQQRITARELRQQLEPLATVPSIQTPKHQTPNGVAMHVDIHDQLELVTWCEANWDVASHWLYDNNALARQIEQRWGKSKLAEALRMCVSAHPNNWDMGLDAALAACDPDGYGRASAEVYVYPPSIDFGGIPARKDITSSIEIHNTGRRLARAEAQLPIWISGPTTIQIRPHTSKVCDITARTQSLKHGNVQDTIQLTVAAHMLAVVPVKATISLWQTFCDHAPTLRRISQNRHLVRFALAGPVIVLTALLSLHPSIPARMISAVNGNPLLILGLVLLGMSWGGFLIQGARQKKAWAIFMLLIPILAQVVFTFTHRARAKIPFVIGLIAIAPLLLGGIVAAARQPIPVANANDSVGTGSSHLSVQTPPTPVQSTTVLPSGPKRARVTASGLNVRESPDPTNDSNIIGTLRRAKEVEILEETQIASGGRWMHIRSHNPDLEGWVNAHHLEVISP